MHYKNAVQNLTCKWNYSDNGQYLGGYTVDFKIGGPGFKPALAQSAETKAIFG